METKRMWGKAVIAAVLLFIPNIVNASITDVNIVPAIPTTLDIIFIETYGIEGYGPVNITSTDFYQNSTSLELDIFLDVGPYSVVTPWSHTENIGTLSTAIYNLTVRTYENSVLDHTYMTSFEVVPEPITLLIICSGLPFLRKRRKP